VALLPVSATFAAAVRSSHQIVIRADVWYGGQMIAGDVPVTGGTLTIDDDADIRSSGTVTVADAAGAWVPVIGQEATRITPWGHEIQLRYGVVLPSGGTEYVSLGWFRIQTVKVDERWRVDPTGAWMSGGAEIEIEIVDRMAVVDDSRFLTISQPPAAAKCLAEIRRLCAGLVPIAAWPVITDPNVPSDVIYDENRMAAIKSLAGVAGVKVFMDRAGNLAIRQLAVTTGGDITFTGAADGGLISVAEEYARDGMYNAVVARGEQDTDAAPVQGIAYDTDPASPTRWDGPFRRVPAFYASPMITTVAQAQAAATTRLATYLKSRQQDLTIEILPNPAMDPGLTTVTVVTPRRSVTGRLRRLTLPLGADGAATATVQVAPSAPTR
jgi:hypothetical protein